jgi:hypothetical protein
MRLTCERAVFGEGGQPLWFQVARGSPQTSCQHGGQGLVNVGPCLGQTPCHQGRWKQGRCKGHHVKKDGHSE